MLAIFTNQKPKDIPSLSYGSNVTNAFAKFSPFIPQELQCPQTPSMSYLTMTPVPGLRVPSPIPVPEPRLIAQPTRYPNQTTAPESRVMYPTPAPISSLPLLQSDMYLSPQHQIHINSNISETKNGAQYFGIDIKNFFI